MWYSTSTVAWLKPLFYPCLSDCSFLFYYDWQCVAIVSLYNGSAGVCVINIWLSEISAQLIVAVGWPAAVAFFWLSMWKLAIVLSMAGNARKPVNAMYASSVMANLMFENGAAYDYVSAAQCGWLINGVYCGQYSVISAIHSVPLLKAFTWLLY